MKRISTATRVVDKFGAGKDGYTDGDVVGGVPATDLEAALFDNLQEELANIAEGAGLVLNGVVLTQVRQAIKRIAGGNVTAVNFAASPFALNADHAGMVLVDATAGNVVINLPAANVLTGLPYEFRRKDATANTVTVNRAGADLIDEVFTSLSLSPKHVQKVRSSGEAWSTVSIAFSDAAEIKYFATSTAPPGYLKANGAAVSRTVYTALFERIGTAFGAGDGATTFALPDARGEFLRGWDDGRGIDPARVFGSNQGFMVETHTHPSSALPSVNSRPIGTGVSEAATGGTVTGSYGGTETRPRNIALLACIKY